MDLGRSGSVQAGQGWGRRLGGEGRIGREGGVEGKGRLARSRASKAVLETQSIIRLMHTNWFAAACFHAFLGLCY